LQYASGIGARQHPHKPTLKWRVYSGAKWPLAHPRDALLFVQCVVAFIEIDCSQIIRRHHRYVIIHPESFIELLSKVKILEAFAVISSVSAKFRYIGA
jgi:hypothetical protein